MNARNKIYLTDKMKEERFRWCLERENWSMAQWQSIVWTDECTIQNFSNARIKLFTNSTASDPKNFNRQAGILGKYKVNFWGFISYNKLKIFLISGKFNKDEYLRILRDEGALQLIKELIPEVRLFQQDNLRTHFVQSVTEFIDDQGLELLDFPVYSPDLSPIENIWAILKKYVQESLSAKQVSSEQELWQVVENCSEKIPLIYVQNSMNSMPDRCQKVMKNVGEMLDA